MSKYKMGRWRGSVTKLMQRYTTCYGYGFECIVYQVDNSVEAERMLKKILRPHHWRNELYHPEAIPSFVEIGSEFCMDNVFSMDMLLKNAKRQSRARVDELVTSIEREKMSQKRVASYAEEQNRAWKIQRTATQQAASDAKAQKKAKKKQKAIEKENDKVLRQQKAEQQVMDGLGMFIDTHCELRGDFYTETTTFREAFQTTCNFKLTPASMKSKMDSRGYEIARKRFASNQNPKHAYMGLKLLHV